MAWDEATGPITDAKIDLSSTGGEVIAAVAGKRIRIISLFLTGTTAGTVQLKTGTTAKTGACPTGATGGFVLNENHSGWCTGAVGENFNIVLANAGAACGCCTYQLIL